MWIHHHHHVGEFGGWGFGFFVIGVLVLLVLLGVALLVFRGPGLRSARQAPTGWSHGGASAASGAPGGAPTGGPGGSWESAGRLAEPERILGERFARGEIDEEEYQRRLKVLREPGGGPGGGS